jgi:hypothetical protein
MYARKMMKPKVERRKADLCSVWTCRLHVNASDQRRPQQECQQEPDPRPQMILFVHTHSVLSVCTSDGINGIEALQISQETGFHIRDTKRVMADSTGIIVS